MRRQLLIAALLLALISEACHDSESHSIIREKSSNDAHKTESHAVSSVAADTADNPYGSTDYQVITLPEYGIAVRFRPDEVGVYKGSRGEIVARKNYRELLEYRHSYIGESTTIPQLHRVNLANCRSSLWHESTWSVIHSAFHEDTERPVDSIDEAPRDGFSFSFEHEGSRHTTWFYGPIWYYDENPLQFALLSLVDWTATWRLETHQEYYSRTGQQAEKLRSTRRALANWQELKRPGQVRSISDVPGWVFLQYGIAPRGYLIHDGILYWVQRRGLRDPQTYHSALMAFDGNRAVALLDADDVPMEMVSISRHVEGNRGYLYACAGRGDGCSPMEGVFLDLENGTYMGTDTELKWSLFYNHDFRGPQGRRKIMYADEYYFGLRDGRVFGRWVEWDKKGESVVLAFKIVSDDGQEKRILYWAQTAGSADERIGDEIKLNAQGEIVYYGELWGEPGNPWEILRQNRSTGSVISHEKIAPENLATVQKENGIDPEFTDRYCTPWHEQFREARTTERGSRVLTEPSVDSHAIRTLGHETVLVLYETGNVKQIDGTTGSWALIRTKEGIRGWYMSAYLSDHNQIDADVKAQ